MSFHLSAALDPASIREQFAQQRFAQIESVLPGENAKRVLKCLSAQTPWNLVFNDDGKHVDLDGAQFKTMPREKSSRLQQAIFGQARTGFQYCYNNYPIFDAYAAGLNKGHLLHQFYEWMNGDEFLDFARAITGFDDISFVDAQATRYLPGHFLTTHDDARTGRRAAYVFNFTPNWRADWGGYLQLLDEHGDVRRGLLPRFNVLNILAVPQKHNVSLVAPFAGGMRFSITGWFRFDDKPARPRPARPARRAEPAGP